MYLNSFKNAIFRNLFASIVLSNLANSIANISLIWLAYNKFGSPIVIAVVLGALQLPSIILGPILGGLLDKFNKLNLMIFANTINIFVFLFLIFNGLNNHIDLLIFIVLLIISGAMKPLLMGGDSMIIQEIFPSGKERMKANAFVTMSFDMTYIFGSLTSGLVLALGYGIKIYALVSVFYAVITLLLFKIRGMFTFNQESKQVSHELSYLQNTKNAFHIIFRNKQLVLVLLMDFFWNMLLWAGLAVLLPVMVKQILHSGSQQYGLLESMTSIGIIVGSFVVGQVEIKESWLIKGVVVAIGIHGILFSLIGFLNNVYLVSFVLVIIGVGVSPALIYKTTFYQQTFDEQAKGALFTISGSMTSASYPIGITLTSILVTFGKTTVPFIFAGYGVLISLLALLVYHNIKDTKIKNSSYIN